MTGLRMEMQVTSAVVWYATLTFQNGAMTVVETAGHPGAGTLVGENEIINFTQVADTSNPNNDHLISGSTAATVQLVISDRAHFADFVVGENFYLGISPTTAPEGIPNALREQAQYLGGHTGEFLGLASDAGDPNPDGATILQQPSQLSRILDTFTVVTDDATALSLMGQTPHSYLDFAPV